jgi:hypothetical protein
MKKIWIAVAGIIACNAAPSYADGHSQETQGLIAGKGQFPGPSGSGQEGALPQTDDTMDDSDNTTPSAQTPNNNNGQAGKKIVPEAGSNNPQGNKEIFPQEKSTNPSMN